MIVMHRRMALTGLASLPLAAGLLNLVRHALAETGLENVEIVTPNGFSQSAVMVAPATVPAPALLLIHGSDGLTDQYKDWAVDFAREGFVALAVDDVGGSEELSAWVEWLKHDPRTNSKVGVVGWSSGSQWALLVSMATPVEATVVYVGLVDTVAERLTHLRGPVLAHLGNEDTSKEAAEMLQDKMNEAGRSLTVYWYSGGHSFPWPGEPGYKKEMADVAWARTVQFLHANLQ
jgi:carboxymethylenebutenolidase